MDQQIEKCNQPITKLPYVKPEVAELGNVEAMTEGEIPPGGSGKIGRISSR